MNEAVSVSSGSCQGLRGSRTAMLSRPWVVSGTCVVVAAVSVGPPFLVPAPHFEVLAVWLAGWLLHCLYFRLCLYLCHFVFLSVRFVGFEKISGRSLFSLCKKCFIPMKYERPLLASHLTSPSPGQRLRMKKVWLPSILSLGLAKNHTQEI